MQNIFGLSEERWRPSSLSVTTWPDQPWALHDEVIDAETGGEAKSTFSFHYRHVGLVLEVCRRVGVKSRSGDPVRSRELSVVRPLVESTRLARIASYVGVEPHQTVFSSALDLPSALNPRELADDS